MAAHGESRRQLGWEAEWSPKGQQGSKVQKLPTCHHHCRDVVSLLVGAPEPAGLALAAEMYGPSMGEKGRDFGGVSGLLCVAVFCVPVVSEWLRCRWPVPAASQVGKGFISPVFLTHCIYLSPRSPACLSPSTSFLSTLPTHLLPASPASLPLPQQMFTSEP